MEAVFGRFLPSHDRVRTLIAEGKVGPVKNVVMTFGQKNCDMPGRRLVKKSQGGGTVMDYGQVCSA